MNTMFSDRISDVPKSFIREILKVAVDPEVISFAGGLPNRELFPLEELKIAANRVFEEEGTSSLQYSNSEGSPALREFIADRYKKKFDISVSTKNILITSGSQQGLDLLGKTFLNEGDDIIIEEPGYLGAIQAFSVYKTSFNPVVVGEHGMDTKNLDHVLTSSNPKLIYTVPNFQNPSGISYSEENRKTIAEIIKDEKLYLIEDDPYGELRYKGTANSSFKQLIPEKTIMLGSFSKTVVPGFRLGWIVAPEEIYEKLLIAKQASDLHTNQFGQEVLVKYFSAGNYDAHILKLVNIYGGQREAMINSIKKHFPDEVEFTQPDGGMFLWVKLPNNISSMKLFHIAIDKKVAFVPGAPFYVHSNETNTLRLNFSNVNETTIDEGIGRLGLSLKELLGGK